MSLNKHYMMSLNGLIVNTTTKDDIANYWLEMVGITKNDITIGCEIYSEEEYQAWLDENRGK